jgi:hypothetical protein
MYEVQYLISSKRLPRLPCLWELGDQIGRFFVIFLLYDTFSSFLKMIEIAQIFGSLLPDKKLI